MISHRAGSSSSSFLISAARFRFCFELLEDVADLELAQAVELGFEDGVGLDLGQLEPLDQLGRRVGLAVAVADDLDGLVEVLEDDRKPLEDVDPLEQDLELVAEAAGHHVHPEVEELLEDRLEIEPAGHGHLGPRGRQQAGQVDVVVDLERRVLVQVGQGRVGTGARAQLQDDPDVVGTEVLDVDQLRHLPLADQLADPLHQGVFLDAVGNGRDEHGVGAIGVGLVGAPELDAPLPGRVDLADFLGRVEDHAAGGKVGTLDVPGQLLQGKLPVIQERHEGRCRPP